eukprot:354873-Chlamydomonas_euryale.AAC.5
MSRSAGKTPTAPVVVLVTVMLATNLAAVERKARKQRPVQAGVEKSGPFQEAVQKARDVGTGLQ